MDNAQYKREETEKYLAKCFSNTKSCHIGWTTHNLAKFLQKKLATLAGHHNIKERRNRNNFAKCCSKTKLCHIGCDNTLGEKKDNFAKFISITTHKGRGQKKKSERPIDALAVKTVNHPLTDNLESRDASASKNRLFFRK